MLHDVGKIGVSADLLSRRSALSVGEQDLVRRHVDMSAAVISDMPRLARVAEAVHAHQKHHDGGDYPAEAAGGQLDPELVQEFLRVIDRQGEQAADVQAEAG
jgi:HD-GYP domain-containing protein (c-di-GMP phosphodiesterase class II)